MATKMLRVVTVVLPSTRETVACPQGRRPREIHERIAIIPTDLTTVRSFGLENSTGT